MPNVTDVKISKCCLCTKCLLADWNRTLSQNMCQYWPSIMHLFYSENSLLCLVPFEHHRILLHINSSWNYLGHTSGNRTSNSPSSARYPCVFTELILNSDVATVFHGNGFWKVTTACESKPHWGKQDKMSQYNTYFSFINSLLTDVPFETGSVNLYKLRVLGGGVMGDVPFWTWPYVTCVTTDWS